MLIRIATWLILSAAVALLAVPANLNTATLLWLTVSSLVAVFLMWIAATVAFLALFAISSVDDFGDLLRAAFRSAAPAMWFVPALLLISGAGVLRLAAGCLLAANAVRLLLSQAVPRKLKATNLPDRKLPPLELFESSLESTSFSWSGTLAAILGALALQLGLYAILTGSAALAIVGFCGCAAMWSVDGRVRGVRISGRPRDGRFVMSDVTMTIIIAALLSGAQLGSGAAELASRLPPALIPAIPGLETASKPIEGHRRKPDLNVTPLAAGVPGVVFRPEVKLQPRPTVSYPSGGTHVSFLRSVTFPFTGEYHVFPSSNGRIGSLAQILKGTPLDSRYQSLSGGTVETQAYQKLTPPIDLTECRAIEMMVSSAEVTPASAAMQLIVGGRVQDLGIEIFGLESKRQEKLTFEVPTLAPSEKVEAIRIVFNRDPSARHQTVKVAIQWFTLLART